MTAETPNQQPQTPEARETGKDRRWTTLVWRVLAVAVIVAAAVLVAHVLSRPGGWTRTGGEGGLPVATGDSTRRAGETEEAPFTPLPRIGPSEVPQQEWTAAKRDLAQVMAGILMAAAEDEEGDYEVPENQTPQDRREFLAERFGLPADYPRSDLGPGVVPEGAEVLAVFDNPETEGTRMILVRVRLNLEEALAAFHKLYASEGWALREPIDPKAQTERGWLVWFIRQGRHRILYAEPREGAEETLAAVCELRY
ncbi:MAG: hypothetical protein WBD75_05685 [Phycisphaerae bacterium]